MSARQIQGRYAAERRYRPDEDHTPLRQELKAAQLEEHIAKVVAEWPPLTLDARDRLAVLLRGAK